MSKKRKRTRKPAQPRGWKAPFNQVMRWLDELEDALRVQNFGRAKQLARKILRHVPAKSAPGKDALNHLGTALAMRQEYEASYQVLSEALALQPDRADLWYNRSLSAGFTMRTGQALRDIERAVALEQDTKLLATFNDRLDFMRHIVTEEIALRGPAFTLEQLIEQQSAFNQAIALMEKKRYADVETLLKRVIEMGDVLPQPWGNLAGCYMMQERYDEAEAALKRALEIDPDYALARENLQKLPFIRQHGIGVMYTTIKPAFGEEKINHGLTFVE